MNMDGTLLKKVFSAASLGCLAFALLFSAAFFYSHIGHDHQEEDCPVCSYLAAARNLPGAAPAEASLSVPRSFLISKNIPGFSFCSPTSITLKVQSNT
jgi:hypothetical protein